LRLNPDSRQAADQSIANAATINPIMPTAMIVFVIVSIVASEKL